LATSPARNGFEGAALEAELRSEIDRLTRQNADLKRSNEDLESFAYAASHDLQEPLRMITTYAQLLAKRYEDQLDEDVAMFVANIVNGGHRMQELVSDLLIYSQVGCRPETAATSVDLNSVLETVTENLKTSIEETGAVVTSDRLPVLSAHASDFIQLFQNLIANSVKYRGEGAPRIHISVQRQSGELRFAVSDNGMGIDAAHHKRIFQPFKRLHDNKIPGTGLGLATCARIVKRYGGRISVESRTGEGATFLFTLHDTGMTPAAE
jgi:light-regulated signal transduction histidine kinase (bacteriophytochrome)